MTTTLDVLSIEYGIKSSGVSMGSPCVSLRLAGCNLRCRDCRRYGLKGTEMLTEEIADAISLLKSKNLVITGGEPLKQRMRLLELLKILPYDWKITLETNGTLSPRLVANWIDKWDVAFKLHSSGQKRSRRFRGKVISQFALLNNVWYAFEIYTHQDLYEMNYMIKKYGFDREKIILMAFNPADENLRKLIFEQAKNKGMAFQVPLSFAIR